MAFSGDMQPESELPRHVLVAGVDGSGKSTLLTGLSEIRGYIPMEPTSTERARLFRGQTLDSPITHDLISQREAIFLELNRTFSVAIGEHLALEENVATTSSMLVTVLAHAVMKRVALDIGNPMDAVHAWIDDDTQKPDALYLTHAPFATIRSRIAGRYEDGDKLEKFWGFNSPFFLNHYQDAWLETLDLVQCETDVQCRSVDTSIVAADQTVQSIEESL